MADSECHKRQQRGRKYWEIHSTWRQWTIPTNNVRIRQGALVLRGDTTNSNASVTYFKDGKFYRAAAKAVIFAGQSHTARTACEHLLSASQANAFDQVTLSPVLTANVTLRSAAPIVDLGYDGYYWGSQYWADFVVADWVGPNRSNANRQTVLTFYGGIQRRSKTNPVNGFKLLTTPFSSYEDSLRADLNRVLAGRNFDFDRDVTAVYLYRWGHSMVYPKPGWPFSAPINKNGQVIRVPSARFYARQQLGRISFGAQDVESSPANESALGAGVRTKRRNLTAALTYLRTIRKSSLPLSEKHTDARRKEPCIHEQPKASGPKVLRARHARSGTNSRAGRRKGSEARQQ